MKKKKKIIVYSAIGLIILGAIIFILCSHFMIEEKHQEFSGFTFKEVTELNYGTINLSSFIDDVTCEEECLYQGDTLDYTITNIEDLGSQEILVSVTYEGKKYEKTYQVEVIDTLAPNIVLSAKEIEIVKNSEFDPQSYIFLVSDNYDEVSVDDIEIDDQVNTKKVGDYQVLYTITDSHDNMGNEILTVHVTDEKAENTSDNQEKNKENTTNNTNKNNNTSNNTTANNTNFKTAINNVSLSPLKTRYTDLDNQIANIISSVTNSGMSNYEKLQAIYNYVKNKLSYEMMILNYNELWEMQDKYSYYDYDGMDVMRAKYSLSTGKGVCDNYAALFMILARRIGFDAYVVGGSVNKVGGGTTGHAWVMIKAGSTYYIFDPQIEDSKGTSYDYFGKTDAELPIYHYTLSSNISKFHYFKENPNQPHEFEATFTTNGALTTEKNLASNGTTSSYSSSSYELGETVNVTFKTSRTQKYTLEILKNDQVISSESYDGSSKTVTLTFDEVGTTYYNIKIKVTSSYSVTFGVNGTVKESNTTNTTENEA